MYFSVYDYFIDYSFGSHAPTSQYCGDEMSLYKKNLCQICPDGLAWINYDGIFYCAPMPLPNGYTSALGIYPPSPGNNC